MKNILASFVCCLDKSLRIQCATQCSSYLKPQHDLWMIYQSPSSLFMLENYPESISEIDDRLKLNDRFGRWRFLQNVLDEETRVDDTNLVLQIILEKCLRSAQDVDVNKLKRDESSPESSDNKISLKNTVLERSELLQVLVLPNNSRNEVTDVDLLSQLEKFLPDSDDEDAWKSLWDMILELHGREAVKIDEMSNNPNWKARLLITQILLHYDFLTIGLK